MSRKNVNHCDNQFDQWTIAAAKAREEIAKARVRICLLEESVKVFLQNSRSGEPWPGTATQRDKKTVEI